MDKSVWLSSHPSNRHVCQRKWQSVETQRASNLKPGQDRQCIALSQIMFVRCPLLLLVCYFALARTGVQPVSCLCKMQCGSPCNNFPAIISVPHMSCQIKRHVTPSCTGESQFLWNALWHCRLQIATCAIVHSECHCTFQNALCPYCGLAPSSVCRGLQCVVRRPLLCWVEECNAYWCCVLWAGPARRISRSCVLPSPGGHTAERDEEGGMGGIWVVMERGLGLEWGGKK